MKANQSGSIAFNHNSDPISAASTRYQQCIRKLSDNPKYQHLLVVSISIFWLLITFNAMIGSFVFMNPLFDCNGEAKTESYACEHLKQCTLTNSFTAVKKNGMYCDKRNIRSTIQSIFALGLFFGMIVAPRLGDSLGRRRALLSIFGVGVIGFAILTIAIQINSQIFMAIGSILNGVFGSGITILGFILTCDFCEEKLRQQSLILYCAMWGIGQSTFYLLYNYMPEWNNYLMYTLLIPTGTLFLLCMLFKIESPAFALFVKKDINLFKQILRSLAKYNNITAEKAQEIIQDAEYILTELNNAEDGKQNSHLVDTLRKIFGNPNHLQTCVCLILVLTSFNFFYYGMQGSMERTGLNFGINMLLIGINEFLAYLSANYLTKYIPRKPGTIISVLFTCLMGLLFLFDFVHQSSVFQSILAVMARVGSVYAFCFLLLMQSQLLQVEIRSTAVSMIMGVGEIARIVVPFLINLLNDMGIPIFIVSSILFVVLGTLPVVPLRETLVKKAAVDVQPVSDVYSQIKTTTD